MSVNQQLMRLCEAILNNSTQDELFGNLLIEAGVKLDDNEWNFANKLLEKSEEIFHAAGGRENRTYH